MARTKDVVLAPEQTELMEKEYLERTGRLVTLLLTGPAVRDENKKS